ncbi:MAG: tail fiber domain-containing protein, partial [Winogradskyella sp.]|nr:tail fiber domain-containing protein [Winogradskyella sp.]
FDIGNSLINQHWDEVVANTFVTYSDRRTKTHISELPYGLEDLMKLQPVSYSYNETISPNDRTRLGLIAQDVEKIIPEVVITEDVDIDPKTGEKTVVPGDYLAMSYIELIPVLIKAVQEQQNEIVALRNQLENYQSLEKRIKALEDKN